MRDTTSTFTLTGSHPVFVSVERKRIRHLYLHVNPGGRVSISAPLAFSDEEIRAFVLDKADWLMTQVSRMEGVSEQAAHTYETGDALMLWGEAYPLTFLPDRQKSLSFSGDRVILTMPASSDCKARSAFVRAEYKKRLLRALHIRLPYWERETGLVSREVHVCEMKSRWGSCNTATRSLNFNLTLILHPAECLDYVIVHELAHLRYARHDEDFWALVGRFIPDYDGIKKRLTKLDREQVPL